MIEQLKKMQTPVNPIIQNHNENTQLEIRKTAEIEKKKKLFFLKDCRITTKWKKKSAEVELTKLSARFKILPYKWLLTYTVVHT